MMSFDSWRSFFTFSWAVNRKQRYILDEESQRFLNAIIETCKERELSIPKGATVWRAQNGHAWRPMYQTDPETDEQVHVDDVPIPFPHSRMKPLEDSASEGRANSKGIPCLYVATNKETAMSEIRPWLGAIVSLGVFKTTKDLKILDFSVEHGVSNTNFLFYFNEPSEEEKKKAVWSDIDNAFSKPVRNSDSTSDYAATQIISEFVKSKGYDGIAYKSSLADGHNIVLFDLASAEVLGCQIHEVSKVQFEFKRIEEH
ncbi:RES family NAD+ phosphorylase [Vibrio parahaemolyticus]|uniref:RES family NAD+ phosphorylase n=3 Tax=Vibrio parahaemolyticus TaxID=670 RepID=UPI001E29F241|nr:RES family NAD+ phosphorylase [Vibrio parahaemolyticus]